MEDKEKLTGIVEEIVYYNDENGYTVMILINENKENFTAVGYAAPLSEGESVSLTGKWVVHYEYGEQFKFSDYNIIMPTEEKAILKYLSSGIVYGVKSATAKKIVDEFGTEALNIMLTDPLRLATIKGISVSRAEKIGESFREVQATQNIVFYLQRFDISANIAIKVYNHLGADAVSKIENNPYILADDVDGITFKTADSMAMAMGFAVNEPRRIKSGLKYILRDSAYTMGNTFVPKSILTEQCAYTLGISDEDVEIIYPDLMISYDIMPDTIDGVEVIYLTGLYNAETYIAHRLKSMALNCDNSVLNPEEADEYIRKNEEFSGITLAEKQREAVRSAVQNGCMVLTGGPGTGKTTTINTIIQIFKDLNLKVALTAPTGRAAKRMSQVTGTEAKTIHRLLEATGADEVSRFARNESNLLSADVIIVDEVSMIDVSLMSSLLKAIKPGARLILSGDADQLPSVGAGNVLHDIIKSQILPVVCLDKIFRQAEKSYIVVNAHRINNGQLPYVNQTGGDFFYIGTEQTSEAAEKVAELYIDRLPKAYGYDSLQSIQVLSPTKKGTAGTINLNKILQERINHADITKSEYAYGSMVFRVGDKVMQIKNNYDIIYIRNNNEQGTGIFNGDMGIIKEISTVDKMMVIEFDDNRVVEYPFEQLDELDLAYAITVHKSQGSEFPVVVMPVCAFSKMLMCRNLFYTAITRAKELVVLVGSIQSIQFMINNNTIHQRWTGLCEKLKIKNDEISL